MALDKNALLNRAKVYYNIHIEWDKIKNPLFKCLSLLDKPDIVKDNPNTYNVLLGYELVYYITYRYEQGDLKSECAEYGFIPKLFGAKSDEYIYKQLGKFDGIRPVSIESINQIYNAINTLNISSDKADNAGSNIDELKEVWKSKLNEGINSIMNSYKLLYESGYGLIQPVGVLTNRGIYRSFTDGQVKLTGDSVSAIEIYDIIAESTGNQYKYFSNIGEEISINKLSSLNGPLTMIEYHLRFMFGHLNYAKGKHSLRSYLTKHNINNDSTTKILKYSHMEGYIREQLEDIFVNAYLESGITPDVSSKSIEAVNNINRALTMSLKNVIVVAEKKDNINTRLRICSDNRNMNIDSVMNKLRDKLNIGTSSSVEVKLMEEPRYGVYDINIIYNSKAYFNDALFAYEVVDILHEQGIRPAWDNVVLGKTDDGNIFTYNFKDPNNSAIAIYGSKGSGKGVMTLNLVASALSDGCKLLYMDAKPDTAVPLAQTAWKSGLDACVFNGIENAGAGLEDQYGCIRDKELRFSSKSKLPDGLFSNDIKSEQFILLTTYYRGVELCLDLAENRAKVVTNGGHNDDWWVMVFDECQQLAATERSVMENLDTIKKARTKHKELDEKGKPKTINYLNDPIYVFIQEYENWMDDLKTRLAKAIGSTFRKAEISAIYIWQTTDFPSKYTNDSVLAKVIMQESSAMVKIVGRGAAVSGGSTTFGTPSSLEKTSWYDNRFSGSRGGYWAIGNNVNSGMKVFRPFNVYSNANDKDLLIMNAKAAGLTEADLYGKSLNLDGTVKPEIGFEGYVNKLLTPYNLSAATQLNSAYAYADKFLAGLGKGSLLSFMYNAHSFNKLQGRENLTNLGSLEFNNNSTPENNDLNSGEVLDYGSDRSKYYSKEAKPSWVRSASGNYVNPKFEIGDQYKTTQSSYRMGTKDDGYYTFITPSEITELYNLTPENSTIVTVADYRDISESSKFLNSLRGAEYELSSRWDCILNKIAETQNPLTVTAVILTTDLLVFNKRIVATMGLLGGEDGVSVSDIISFKALSKKFKNIKDMTIDLEIYNNCLYNEFGSAAIPSLFSIFNKLNILSINKGFNSEGKPNLEIYTRAGLADPESQKRIKDNQDRFDLRRGIDAMAASKNPRIGYISPIEKYRLNRGCKYLTSSAWESCKRNFRDDKWLKGSISLTATAIGVGVGTSLSAVDKLFNAFNNRR